MIGILLNTYRITDENLALMTSLQKLAETPWIKVQVNVTNPESDEMGKIPYNPYSNFALTLCNYSNTELTNAQLRGRYKELNSRYVFFIDDDFKIINEDAFKEALRSAGNYMDEYPTCSIIRFQFNNSEKFYEYHKQFIKFPIISTSLSCGLFMRSSDQIFTDAQLNWHWKTDDFTMILNALKRGFGVELENHGLAHMMKGSQSMCRFDKRILEPVFAEAGSSVITDSSDIIPYITSDPNSGLRPWLIKQLQKVNGYHNFNKRSLNILSSSACSMLIDNERMFDSIGIIHYLSRHKSSNPKVISSQGVSQVDYDAIIDKECAKADVLILSAGTLGKEFVGNDVSILDNISTMTHNLNILQKFISRHHDGVIIYLGSVASYRGYPDHPGYAGEKSFMKTYLESIQKKFNELGRNLKIHYLTIPSTKTKMCDHGYESSKIVEHIRLLCNQNSDQRILKEIVI